MANFMTGRTFIISGVVFKFSTMHVNLVIKNLIATINTCFQDPCTGERSDQSNIHDGTLGSAINFYELRYLSAAPPYFSQTSYFSRGMNGV